MSVFYDLNKTPRNILNQAIVRAIISENNGALFDPSDLSTLYQDEAGTTPVTAVEQPVGLMLDKSRGMMLGPELVSNGTFDSGIVGWEQKYNATTSYSLGSLKVMPAIIDANGAFAGQAIPTAIGRSYKVTFDLVTANAATYIRALNNINVPWVHTYGIAGAAVGNKSTLVFTATATVTYIAFGVSGAESLTNAAVYDNISVRELYGYHATQSITALRPTLSARYNLLTKTEDFSDAVWAKTNVVPSGLKITENTTTGTHSLSQLPLSCAAGNSLTCEVKVKKEYGARNVRISLGGASGSAFVVVNLTTGNVVLNSTSGTKWVLNWSTQPAVVGEWVKISLSASHTETTGNVGLLIYMANTSNVTYTGDGVSSISIKDINLLQYTYLSVPYQRVNTATDYDTDERYFKKYLRFDGADDYLNLPYMGLYANGSASVVMVRDEKSSHTFETYTVSERSNTTIDQYYILDAKPAGLLSCGAIIRNDSITTIANTISAALASANIGAVFSYVDSGTNIKRFKNSAQATSNDYVRSGTLTLNNTKIGAYVISTGGVGFINNNLYGLIITKSALTDSQRVACERYLGRKAGAQL